MKAAWILTVLAAALLSGCGGGRGGSAEPDGGSVPGTDAATADAGAADSGGALRDAASRDAGADVSLPDAESVPAEVDAGSDAGYADAGVDASRVDAGTDAGAPDAGLLPAWTRASLPAPSGLDSYAKFGAEVAVSRDGRTIAIGDSGSGQVSVFDRGTGDWSTRVVISHPSPDVSGFGWSVALDGAGATLVVGTPSVFPTGGVFVYRRSGGTWSPDSPIAPPAGAMKIGDSVAISADGRQLVAGDAARIGRGDGQAHVFGYATGAWSVAAMLTPPATISDFGENVAMSAAGNRVAVGDGGFAPWSGAVSVYDGGGATWSLPRPLAPPAGAEAFGRELAMSSDGSTIAVTYGTSAPTSVVFREVGATWVGEPLPDVVALDVALDGHGTLLVCGHPTGPSSAGGLGQVSLYRHAASGWVHEETLPLPADAYDFGSSVAVDDAGRTLVVGDINGGAGGRGTAFVYTR